MAWFYLVCVEDRRYVNLGKWTRSQSDPVVPGTPGFEGLSLKQSLGRLPTSVEVQTAIEAFIAQSGGKTIRLEGFNGLQDISNDEDWHEVTSLKELEGANPPDT